MTYTYDILLNWTKDERLKEFYEWNLEDDLEHIKKIPIIRVNESFLKDLLTAKIKIDSNFLSKIKYKTESYFHNEIDVIDYAFIVTTLRKALALELDSEGNVVIAIPTKVSDLANDKGYLTAVPDEYITEAELTNKKYVTQTDLSACKSRIETLEAKVADITKYFWLKPEN